MNTITLELNEIYDLAKKTLLFYGCNETNANALADNILKAERDGSLSHGLFRLPAYVSSLKSKKVKGNAKPSIQILSNSILMVDGDSGFAPIAQSVGIPEIIKTTKKNRSGYFSIKKYASYGCTLA